MKKSDSPPSAGTAAVTYLAWAGASPGKHRLTTSTNLADLLRQAGRAECRVSPIFPVDPEKAAAEPLAGAGYVGLLCPLRPYEYIGRQRKEVQTKLWFSLGIAAVIVFANAESQIKDLLGDLSEFSAYEVWRVDSDDITDHSSWTREVDWEPCILDNAGGLPKDIARLLEEIQLNLHEALRTAAIYMPEQLRKLRGIATATNEIIAELKYFAAPTSHPRPAQLANLKVPPDEDALGIHRRVNQRTAHLIQLSAALAYVVSQTSHGTIPVLEGPCLIANHSLLGVGTAYRAVSALTGFVDDVFEEHPILAVLDVDYRNMPGVDVFKHLPKFNRALWQASKIGVDPFLQGRKREPNRPKLAYFSSRLGFAETHFSITSATQVLHGADAVRWSLMTLTHELLHSHVTGILATIYGDGISEGLTWESFVRYQAEFKSFAHGGSGSSMPKMLECLRYMIFAFAVYRHDAITKLDRINQGETKITLTGILPDENALFRSFYRSSLRLLEEIIVHTLDLHYFYSGDVDVFLSVLWESWTTVPAVVGDLETYLLRSISAIATMENGSVADRFKLARGHLLQKLADLSVADPKNAFLKKARDHLYDGVNTNRLLVLIYPSFYIADMTAIFLVSRNLEARLWGGDENIVPSGEGEFLYSLETSTFPGTRVKNPIAFLVDYTRRKSRITANTGEDYRSAWLLLATASASPPA